jgi:hypothetical protein
VPINGAPEREGLPARIAPYRRKGYGNLRQVEDEDLLIDQSAGTLFFNGSGKHIRRPETLCTPRDPESTLQPITVVDAMLTSAMLSHTWNPSDLKSDYFNCSDADPETAEPKSSFSSDAEVTDANESEAKGLVGDEGDDENDDPAGM